MTSWWVPAVLLLGATPSSVPVVLQAGPEGVPSPPLAAAPATEPESGRDLDVAPEPEREAEPEPGRDPDVAPEPQEREAEPRPHPPATTPDGSATDARVLSPAVSNPVDGDVEGPEAADPGTLDGDTTEPDRHDSDVTTPGQATEAPVQPLPSLEGLPGLEGVTAPTPASEGARPTRERRPRRIDVRAFVATDVRVYPAGRGGPSDDEQLWAEGELEAIAKVSRVVSFMLRPRFLIDALSPELRRAEPLEAYLDLRTRVVEVRLGQMIENWGVVDTLNPVDVVNRRDFGLDPLSAAPLGELGARVRLLFPGKGAFGDPALTVLGSPVWRRTPLPASGTRWALSGADAPPLVSDEAPSFEDGVFAAAKFEHTLRPPGFGADFSYVGAFGPARFPNVVPATSATGDPELRTVTYREGVAGGGLRLVPDGRVLSRFTLKFEAAYHHPVDVVSDDRDPFPDDSPDLLPDAYTQFVVGVDGSVDRVPGKAKLTATVEYAGDVGADDAARDLRTFEHDFLGRLAWEAGDFARSVIEARVIVDAVAGELILEANVGRNLRFIHDDLRLTIGGRYLRADLSRAGFLSVFANNSDVRARLQFNF